MRKNTYTMILIDIGDIQKTTHKIYSTFQLPHNLKIYENHLWKHIDDTTIMPILSEDELKNVNSLPIMTRDISQPNDPYLSNWNY